MMTARPAGTVVSQPEILRITFKSSSLTWWTT
jgi:hypothetical protein